jgi:hypothetical protein
MDFDLDWPYLVMALGPALFVFLTAYLAFKTFFRQEERKAIYQIRQQNRQTILPVQMQAYERLALLMDRLSPYNLLSRLQEENLMAAQLHRLLLQHIRQEYEHNITQQVYVTDRAWQAVKDARTNLISLINQAASETSADAAAPELGKAILNQMMENETQPTEEALSILKEEARKSFAV